MEARAQSVGRPSDWVFTGLLPGFLSLLVRLPRVSTRLYDFHQSAFVRDKDQQPSGQPSPMGIASLIGRGKKPIGTQRGATAASAVAHRKRKKYDEETANRSDDDDDRKYERKADKTRTEKQKENTRNTNNRKP